MKNKDYLKAFKIALHKLSVISKNYVIKTIFYNKHMFFILIILLK